MKVGHKFKFIILSTMLQSYATQFCVYGWACKHYEIFPRVFFKQTLMRLIWSLGINVRPIMLPEHQLCYSSWLLISAFWYCYFYLSLFRPIFSLSKTKFFSNRNHLISLIIASTLSIMSSSHSKDVSIWEALW